MHARPILLLICVLLPSVAVQSAWAVSPGHSVVLVTLDGVRVEELFDGLQEAAALRDAEDPYSEIEAVRQRYGRETQQERRLALWPNLWGRLAPQGVLLGNRALGNHLRVENQVAASSPGYVELMTGRARAEVVDNTLRRYPYTTVLEHARQVLDLPFHQVALIGAWDGFNMAAASQDGAFLMVGARDRIPAPWSTPELDVVADLRAEVLGLWEGGTEQVLTWHLGIEFLKLHHPRLLWLALGNTDDWAHAGRYDRFLDCIHQQDAILGELWDLLQSLPEYRGRTTLVVTTDHGRGRGAVDWQEHDIGIEGSSDIWALVLGPGVPALGEATSEADLLQGQVSATMLQALGLDWQEWDVSPRPPLPVFGGGAADG